MPIDFETIGYWISVLLIAPALCVILLQRKTWRFNKLRTRLFILILVITLGIPIAVWLLMLSNYAPAFSQLGFSWLGWFLIFTTIPPALLPWPEITTAFAPGGAVELPRG